MYLLTDEPWGVRRFGVDDPNGVTLNIMTHAKPATVDVSANSVSKDSPVTLREINTDTVPTICQLAVGDDQRTFVTPNATSIAEAHFSDHAWFRAIYAGESPVGFVMLEDRPEKPENYLWRFMIDKRYQRMGFGRRALKLLIAHVRTRPRATELLTSVVEAPGGPLPFYERLGFIPTGAYEDDEAMLPLQL